ncbi:unnamed protein product, partial [Rotaria sp. Silwood2]
MQNGTSEVVSKFDLSFNITHHRKSGQLSLSVNASTDLFDIITIEKLTQRFLAIWKQIFAQAYDRFQQPIFEISLLLPNELQLIELLKTPSNRFLPLDCIHRDFARRAIADPQKMAIELDDQGLTYSELFFYVKQLAVHLLTKCDVKVGDIICQCVERSEALTVKVAQYLKKILPHSCSFWNIYGPAELTLDSTSHLVDFSTGVNTISIGMPLPGYFCLVLDDLLQPTVIDQEGELCVGGVGVFAGYLGREDLTSKSLLVIDGEMFYRTGDLVRMDSSGLIYYIGRKDHQVKLRGQRIELGEIEGCLLSTSISACVVTKWGSDHLVAYVQGSNMNEEELYNHCCSRLPPFMVPSIFILLDKFPLNANGKVDRKRLPTPDFTVMAKKDDSSSKPMTTLEERLVSIFSQAFHIECVNINMSFTRLGGTSLDAILAVTLIRQQLYSNFHFGFLLAHPSVRELAQALDSLLVVHQEKPVTSTLLQAEENDHRPMPSLCIETLGIILLVCQWLYPIWWAVQSDRYWAVIFVPIIHILLYVICQQLLFSSDKQLEKSGELYSLCYYRWWFLERLWSINNTYWMQHLVGTPLYNVYLRLCGARIGISTHINTTLIDAPWMLDIGDSTIIASETRLVSLSYYGQTYELHPILIGCHCLIETRSILYGGVNIQNNTHIKPMSAITGHISSSIDSKTSKDQCLSWDQVIYQCTCLLSVLSVHIFLLNMTHCVYYYCSTFNLSMILSLVLCWVFWLLASLSIALLAMKFVIGSIHPKHCSFNSYYYLHKIWLRQLIITSFYQAFEFLPRYEEFSVAVLRWLGAHVDDDVKIAHIIPILRYPSNLLRIEHGVSTFGYVMLAPFEITNEGDCSLDYISLGSGTNLANRCTLMPGTRLS